MKKEKKITELQQPYIENRKKVIGNVLFKEEGIGKRKEDLYRMWKK